MKTASMLTDVVYNDIKPAIKVLLETDFTKEIRIVFKANQLMAKHQAPLPIVVQVVSGEIDFGVNESKINLKAGDLISLESNVPHDLKAICDSIVRLTLSKNDHTSRVAAAVEK